MAHNTYPHDPHKANKIIRKVTYQRFEWSHEEVLSISVQHVEAPPTNGHSDPCGNSDGRWPKSPSGVQNAPGHVHTHSSPCTHSQQQNRRHEQHKHASGFESDLIRVFLPGQMP